MRYSDCYRLAKILLPHMIGFVTNKKSELFLAPIGSIFRGFVFESTAGSREDFYFWWFFMPMAPEKDHFVFSYGERLRVPGGNTGWRTDMKDLPDKLLAAMQPKALPLLRSITGIPHAIRAIRSDVGSHDITYINDLDNLACLMILDEQYDAAREVLDQIIAFERGDDQRQWVLSIVQRMKNLRSTLWEDRAAAHAQVRQWQSSTLRHLKLEKW